MAQRGRGACLQLQQAGERAKLEASERKKIGASRQFAETIKSKPRREVGNAFFPEATFFLEKTPLLQYLFFLFCVKATRKFGPLRSIRPEVIKIQRDAGHLFSRVLQLSPGLFVYETFFR